MRKESIVGNGRNNGSGKTEYKCFSQEGKKLTFKQ